MPASKNDITGDKIQTKPSKAYADNYDAIFRKATIKLDINDLPDNKLGDDVIILFGNEHKHMRIIDELNGHYSLVMVN